MLHSLDYVLSQPAVSSFKGAVLFPRAMRQEHPGIVLQGSHSCSTLAQVSLDLVVTVNSLCMLGICFCQLLAWAWLAKGLLLFKFPHQNPQVPVQLSNFAPHSFQVAPAILQIGLSFLLVL